MKGIHMPKLQLVIANKNYSSWSLRPWMALTMADIPFEVKMIRFGEPRFGREIRNISPAGKVPVLVHGKLVIWDSLAILEYLAESFPDRNLWPKAKAARAMARSVSSEIHSGFSDLRKACPMNLRRPPKPVKISDAAIADVSRIEALWRDCRKTYGKGGKFLFGKFSIADAMYAPIVSRFETYAIPAASDTRAYMANVMATKAFQSWKAGALKESWIVPEDEVD
jgi:glutathione S-transferase